MARETRRSPQSFATAGVAYEAGTTAGSAVLKPAYAPFSCSHLALSSLATLSVGSAAGAVLTEGFSFDLVGALTWAFAGETTPAVATSTRAASTMTEEAVARTMT